MVRAGVVSCKRPDVALTLLAYRLSNVVDQDIPIQSSEDSSGELSTITKLATPGRHGSLHSSSC
jgi:hypothetical protein